MFNILNFSDLILSAHITLFFPYTNEDSLIGWLEKIDHIKLILTGVNVTIQFKSFL